MSTTSLNSRPRSFIRFDHWKGKLVVAIALFHVALIGACCSIAAAGGSSGLLIADGGFGGVLKIKEQDVKVTINNGIAVTEINQIFVNTENRIVEALYTFPVPSGGSVSNFSMIINGKEMIGEVVEKERARQIYQSYKSKRIDPGLLEQVDYKRFEMRVFPIAAGAEQHIKVTYYQQLDFDHDWATYVYPLATSTKGADDRTTGKFALTVDINSEIPITDLKSPSHGGEFVIAKHNAKYARASMETTAGDLSRDVVISFQTKRPRTGLDMIASKQDREDGFFLLTLTAGEELAAAAGGMDYVFVLDISGSMKNKGKLGLSTNAAGAFISSLGTDDRCEVMSFNNVPNFGFEELRSVDDETKAAASEFLKSQRARGGTALRPAVNAALRYKDPDRGLNVVILSDGMTDQAEQKELLSAIKASPEGTRIFCVGVGNEVNRPLLKQLAEEAGGLAAFISQGDDFERQAESFRRKLVHPVATELSIAFDGVEVYDVLPGALPNLFHGSPVRMIGRYKNSGNGTVTIRGNVQGRPFEQNVKMEFPELDQDNPQIERMWAYANVQTLMNEVRRSGETPALKESIVQLCEGYSIVSQYASFIVLENDREYRRWKIERRNATRIQRDRQARQRVQEQLKQMRDSSLASLGPQAKDGKQASSDKGVNSSRSRRRIDDGTQPISTQPVSTQNRDLDLGSAAPQSTRRGNSGGGGGAIDPITASICLGLGAAAAARRRKKLKLVKSSG
ncbi:MAG: Ca-activated chloride channel family protein [Mariniblastus sp.]|jgi:Ca-activated chloride channel family protein